MKTIGIILKKELKRFFTDYRMLIGIILPGFLIFALYSVMGNFIGNFAGDDTEITGFSMYVENEPEVLSSLFKEGLKEFEIVYLDEKLEKKEFLEKIENKELDLYVVYPSNMMESISNKEIPNIEIYYNSASNASLTAYTLYNSILNAYEDSLTNLFDINNSADTKYDLAKNEDLTVKILTMMLPFLLITFLFSGAMGICSESIAGEKERGTIE